MLLALLLSLAQAAELPTDLSAPPEKADADGWVRLSSGEWLHGELKRMRRRDLTYDSDKLDNQVLDWSDVEVLWCSRSMEWMLEDRTALVGPGVLDGDTLQVRTDGGIVEVPRSDLAGIVPGGRRELSHWSLHMDAAMAGWWGNTDQITLNSANLLAREDATTYWRLGYDLALGRNDGVATVNRHRLFSDMNLFINERFYIIPYAAEAYHDPFQNIRLRVTAGAGVGWRGFSSDDFEYFASIAMVYQYLLTFGNEDTANPNGAGTRFEGGFIWDITGDITWATSWMTTLIYTRIGDTFHRGNTRWSIDVTHALSLYLDFTFMRVENPRLDADGGRPQSNDFAATTGFALDL